MSFNYDMDDIFLNRSKRDGPGGEGNQEKGARGGTTSGIGGQRLTRTSGRIDDHPHHAKQEQSKMMAVLSRIGRPQNEMELLLECNSNRVVTFAYGAYALVGSTNSIEAIGKIFEATIHVADRARALKAFNAWWTSGMDTNSGLVSSTSDMTSNNYNNNNNNKNLHNIGAGVRGGAGGDQGREMHVEKDTSTTGNEGQGGGGGRARMGSTQIHHDAPLRSDVPFRSSSSDFDGRTRKKIRHADEGWGQNVRRRSVRYRRRVAGNASPSLLSSSSNFGTGEIGRPQYVWVEAICLSPPTLTSPPRTSSSSSHSRSSRPTLLICERNVSQQVHMAIR